MNTSIRITLAMVLLACIVAASAEQASKATAEAPASKQLLFEKLPGKWTGTVRTWFERDKLADESPVSGEFSRVLDGRFLRHVYSGQMQGKPRHGEELIAYNHVDKRWEVSWVDDFHMSYGILYSQGDEGTARGFRVRGEYDIGPGNPKWGWRTEYELLDDDHLRITAWNIMPDGTEAKAVETDYRRQ